MAKTSLSDFNTLHTYYLTLLYIVLLVGNWWAIGGQLVGNYGK